MQRRTIQSRAFWMILVAGFVTGMGNGSVFGAAMMCFLGRGDFADWGGSFPFDYEPKTFNGFIDSCMLVFGFAYCGILAISFKRHDALESGDKAACLTDRATACHTHAEYPQMLNIIATVLCLALAFSSMLLSWYILMPRKNAGEVPPARSRAGEKEQQKIDPRGLSRSCTY